MRRFYFNEKYNDNLNLHVISEIEIPYTNEDIEEVFVEGKSGSYTIKKGTYKNKKITIPLQLVTSHYNFWRDYERVLEWLENIKDNKLILDNRDKAYRVKYINAKDFIRDLRAGATSNLEFICEPFLTEIEETKIDLTNETNFYYKGTKEGEPKFLIEGTGNIQLIVNGEVVTFRDVKYPIVFDTKFTIGTSNGANIEFEGQFPLLIKGVNTIEVVGNVTKLTMDPRTIYIN